MKDNYTPDEIEKEKSKLNKNMHLYNLIWKDNKKYRLGVNYSDRLEIARRDIESLLHYNIISINYDSGKITWNDPEFYLSGYFDIYGFCCEDNNMYYIFDKLYIEDVSGEYKHTYLKDPDYYIN